MRYGPVPQRRLPHQDGERILMLAHRWHRAASAHEPWATQAKECVDFVEGRQWTEAQLRAMRSQGRAALKLNKIGRIVRLVLGYHRNNKSEARFLPGYDGTGTEQTAEAITRVVKQIAENSHLPYIDTEVFMDGIIGGRGYWDARLDWEHNDLGEAKIQAVDPFTVYLDPDGQDYDLNSCSFIAVSRMVSIDEIETNYGRIAADLLRPFTKGATPISPVTTMMIDGEITPVRTFGQRDDWTPEWWDTVYGLMGDFVDPYRKNIRVIDFQYWQSEVRNVFIDLETGDKSVVPEEWGPEKIEKAIYHAMRIGNPVTVERRPVRRVRWTTLAADMMLYDRWSQYDSYTLTGFFPWFRRGTTRGMVEDLLDPQREVNKRRTAQIEITSRRANGGWLYHENSLSAPEEEKLKRFGSRPGITIKYKGDHKPEQIEPAAPPIAQERLEEKSRDDLLEIAGVNESALGELDKVQSGRAIEARQRQAVIAIQVYMDNFSRSKQLLGGKLLNLVQRHYTEPRVYRILGEDGKFTQVLLNHSEIDPATGVPQIVNDVTRGKYTVVIDETPLSATFANAQFEEALNLLERMPGVLPVPLIADILVDLSSLPRKEEIKQRIQAALGMGAPAIGPDGAPLGPGGGVPGDPAQLAALDQASLPGGNVVQLPVGGLPPGRT